MIKERIKNIWKKIKTIRPRGIYFGAVLLFSLLFSVFGFRSSVFADSFSMNLSNVDSLRWERSLDGGSSYVWGSLNTPPFTTSPLVAFLPNNPNATGYILRSFSGELRNPSMVGQYSYEITFYLELYSRYPGQYSYFTVSECSGLSLHLGVLDSSKNPMDPIFTDTQITSCSVNSDLHLVVQANALVTFDYSVIPSYYFFDLDNYANYLFSCTKYNVPGLIQCSPGVDTSNWGVYSIDYSIETTEDQQTAILRETLYIQKQRAEQDAQDRGDLSDISSTGNQDADNAVNSAEIITNNFLGAVIYLRDSARNIHTTNCVVNFPRVNFTGGGSFSLGNIDFCALSLPSPIAVLSSLAIFGFTLYWSIKLLREFYNLLSDLFSGDSSK